MTKSGENTDVLTQEKLTDYFISTCLLVAGRLGLEVNKKAEAKQCKQPCPDIVHRLFELIKEIEELHPKLKISEINPKDRKSLFKKVNDIHVRYTQTIGVSSKKQK